MNLSNASYGILCRLVAVQASAIDKTAENQSFNVEESVKNGSAETVITMITELESTLRVLKRRLSNHITPQTELFTAAGVNLLSPIS